MPDTDAARLAAAFRSLADALEGRGSKPLQCSGADIPASRLLGMLSTINATALDDEAGSEAVTLSGILTQIIHGADAVDTLADFGLLDE